MFCGVRVTPMLPAANIERARKFYSDKLGLQPAERMADGTTVYRCNGSMFSLYPSQYAGTAKNTAAMFETEDLDRDIRDLRGMGVKFEDYDMGDLKTINGIASMDDVRAAWFKDSEGNILAITERTNRPH